MTYRTKLTLFLFLLYGINCQSQCSLSASLTTSGACLGSTLTVGANNNLSKIIWNNDGSSVATVLANKTYATNGITVAGSIFPGSSLSQFNAPMQICVDANDNMYISDLDNNRVLKWTVGASAGVVVAGGNGGGSAANQLSGPDGVFVDKAGNLYVTDVGNSRIQKWAPGATSGITVAGGHGSGSAANQLSGPTGIFVDAAGSIFIADAQNERVQKWLSGASSGATVAGGNGQGRAANQLFDPEDVFVDNSGNLYVADGDNGRVQEYIPGATSGITVAGGNGEGAADNQVDLPSGLYVDAVGNIYVSDVVNCRIQKWAPGATSGITVAGKGYDGDAPDLLSYPSDVWVDNNGNVFVADQINYRIQEFTCTSSIDNTYTPTVAGQYTSSVYDQSDCLVSTNEITINAYVTPAVSVSDPNATLCAGSYASFTAVPVNSGPTPFYQWQVDNTDVGANSPTFSANNLSNGNVITCTMTSDAACLTAQTASSLPITLTINPGFGLSIDITPSSLSACAGDPVVLSAAATNAGTQPGYQWMVNGKAAGGDSTSFTISTLVDGDTVSCIVNANVALACSTAVSNPVVASIKASPIIPSNQIFTMDLGSNVLLTPNVSGSITSYSWSPGNTLTDSIIADPVADPTQTTIYQLSATGTDGCTATAPITVKVIPPASTLLIPTAFTPNGDGKNDIVYILRVPPGSTINTFLIFDRWGQCVFQANNFPAGDPGYGWNGTAKGTTAAAGAYVYFVSLKSASGAEQLYKGTVMLIR